MALVDQSVFGGCGEPLVIGEHNCLSLFAAPNVGFPPPLPKMDLDGVIDQPGSRPKGLDHEVGELFTSLGRREGKEGREGREGREGGGLACLLAYPPPPRITRAVCLTSARRRAVFDEPLK